MSPFINPMRRLLLALVALTSFSPGCSHPIVTPPDAGSSDGGFQSAVITSAGGAVSLPNGTSVQIPAGALTSTTTITITEDPGAATPSDTTLVGIPVIFGPEGLQFQQPVTVTLTFDPSEVPSWATTSQVVTFTAPAGTSDFTSLGGALADATHVQAQTTHFSVFEPVVPNPPDGGSADAGPVDGGHGADGGPVDAGVAPVATVTSPTAGELVTTQTPTFSVAVTEGVATSLTVNVTDSTGTVTALHATSGSGGTWSATASTPLADGHASVTATATNAVETGPASAVVDFVIDGTQPSTPVITAPVSGAIVSAATPVFTITAGSSAATLTVSTTDSSNATQQFSATNNGNGTWSATPSSALADGTVSATAVATDALGYASQPSASLSFTVDTHPPAAPVVTAPAAGAFVTTRTPTFTVSTTGSVASVKLTVTDSSGTPVVLTATGSGSSWSAIPVNELANGAATVSAVALDALGGSSAASVTVHFTIDSNEPAAPVITSPTSDAVVTTQTPAITISAGGSTTAVTVTITDSANATTKLTATSTGPSTWSATSTSELPTGHSSVVAVASDALGGQSPVSVAVDFTIDLSVPGAPTVTSPTSGQVVTTATPTFVIQASSAVASVNATVTDSTGTPVSLPAVNNGNGTWSATPISPLANGAASVNAVITDSLGDSGSVSATVSFVVDTNAPAVTVTAPAAGEVVTTQTPTFTVAVNSGTATSVTVTVVDSTAQSTQLSATNNGNGTWSATPGSALAQGAASVTASATDAAGRSGGASASVSFSIDTNVPVISFTAPSNGAVVTSATPTFTVLVNSATIASVQITVTDSTSAQTVLNAANAGNGLWSATPGSALPAGAATASATLTDSLSNTFTSPTVSFTIDTTAPSAPTITAPAAEQLVTTATPTVTVSAGGTTSTVIVTLTDSSGTPVQVTATGSSGTWAATPTKSVADGAVTVTAIAEDSIGGASPSSASVTFTVDAHEPAAPTFVSPGSSAIVTTSTPAITVSAPGATTTRVAVTVTDISGTPAVLTALNNGNGTWTATPTTPLEDGDVTATAVAGDALGGSSPTSTALSFVVDTHEPATPVITAPTSGELFTTSTPTFTAQAGGTASSVILTVSDGSGTTTQLTAKSLGSGSWSVTPAQALADGHATVTAVATDTLGGSSAASAATDFIVDTHEPAVPTISSPTSGQVVTTTTPSFTVQSGGTTAAVAVIVTDSSGVPVQLAATSSGSGVWTATPANALASGFATVSAVATDALGGSSAASTTVSFAVDTNLPPTPAITAPTASQVVTTQKPTFRITAAGSTNSLAVTFTDSSGTPVTLSATNQSSGSWTVTPTNALAIGPATVSAVGTDSLGGTSPVSATVSFYVDPNVPSLSITAPASGQVLETPTPTFSATVLAGTASSVVFTVTDSSGNPTQLSGSSSGGSVWTATPTTPLATGEATAYAIGTDSLGHSGPSSFPIQFNVSAGDGSDGGCTGDGGCYACAPANDYQFLNQCTGSQCTPYTTTLPLLYPDGGLPPLQ